MTSPLRAFDLSSVLAVTLPELSPELPAEVFLRRTPPRLRSARKTDRQGPHRVRREPELPALGQVVDNYRLERAIGIGGFGVLYKARHVTLDTTVAIKLMRPSVARERPTLPKLLREEARFAARIDHQNVVRVYDVTTNPSGLTYLVMEYVDGPDLSVMIKHRGALPPKMILKVIRQITAALAAGLRESLIHRDVKPSNILLTRHGVTKLTDFGLARSSHAADLSARGVRGVVGTVGYMSPEQLDRPEDVDFRTDIYSLGVTAYQALTGRLPFSDANAEQCARSHRLDPIPPLPSSVPTKIRELIAWMLHKERDRRPSTYEEFEAFLDTLIGPSR